MLRLSNVRVPAVILLACALAACDSESPITPTQPPPPQTTIFQGTVTRNGATTHTFNSSAGGSLTATLTAVGGGDELVVGFSLGNWFGSACSIFFANDSARTGAALTGTLTGPTPLCVRVYDVGTIEGSAPIPYTIEVVHP